VSPVLRPLPTGATLGLFGGGQLGRMFAKAAARLGYHVHVFAPEAESPAGEVSARHTRAPYDDLEAVARFARSVDAITYEFENVLGPTVEAADCYAPVRPHARVLSVARERLREKSFLRDQGLPTAPFRAVHSAGELADAVRALGTAAVVKTTAFGYDGKGQARVGGADGAADAWRAIGEPGEAVVEQFIEFDGECSLLVARGPSGRTVFVGPFYNRHERHILDATVWRAGDDSPVAREAREIAAAMADALALDGLICIEYFIAPGGLLVNEIAPRPHNSGHLTLEAFSVSQFELQVRLTAGYEPVAPAPRAPAAAMVNLLGDLWEGGEPDWAAALEDPAVCFHLYGKSTPRPGRKMGHLTVLAESADDAERRARGARDRLKII
jgi:5-(carboxyamino)imidazole ribonucleotide synthase